MKYRKHLSVPLTRQEKIAGLIYLFLFLLVLPSAVQLLWSLYFPDAPAVFVNFLFYVINFLAVLVIFHRFLKKSIAIVRKKWAKTLLFIIVGFFVYWIANFAVSLVVFLIMPEFININDATIAEISRDGFYFMAFATILLVPLAEETLFRGLLFRGLHDKSRWAAYLVSTLGFCTLHVFGYVGIYEPVVLLLCFIQYIPAGLCLAWTYEQTNTIMTPVVIHALINAVGIFMLR